MDLKTVFGILMGAIIYFGLSYAIGYGMYQWLGVKGLIIILGFFHINKFIRNVIGRK